AQLQTAELALSKAQQHADYWKGQYERKKAEGLGLNTLEDPQDCHYYTAPLREQWLRAVRRYRWSPTSATRLCSAHFDTDCFETSSLLKMEFGLVHGNRKLKPGAVPTLFKYKEPQRPPIERGALTKRRRAEVD
ncbi:hypothetical protein HPB47_015611, partial [Ixodes persulcatus]